MTDCCIRCCSRNENRRFLGHLGRRDALVLAFLWVIEVEHGHARAELGLVLRALDALDIRLNAGTEQPSDRRGTQSAIDINAIVARARKKKA